MPSRPHTRLALAAGACALVTVPALAGSAGASGTLTPTAGFSTTAPAGAKGPDDLTRLATDRVNDGRPILWTAFQNGVGADGLTPAGNSTVAGYDEATGRLVETISVPGKVDGLTADPAHDRLIATVNEDANSSLFTITPGRQNPLAHYTYSSNLTNGGTDSIAIRDDRIVVVHSNPSDVGQPAQYEVTLRGSVADLTPLYADDSPATDAATGQPTTLGLTDPDTNYVMPAASPRFAGQLALISQGDGQIVFADKAGALQVLTVRGSDTPTQLDGIAVATSATGTLFMADKGAAPVRAFDTSGFPRGTVFATEDNHGVPTLGTLDLDTGAFNDLHVNVSNPKGLVFVPRHGADDPGGQSRDSNQHQAGNQNGARSAQD